MNVSGAGRIRQGPAREPAWERGFVVEHDGNGSMTKSELIERIAARQTQLSIKDVELAVKTILEDMSEMLANGGRIEIRGFGSFSLHFRAPRTGRNPKTGESVDLQGKYVPHFKPGKELRDRVNESLQEEIARNGGVFVPRVASSGSVD